jgi:hypothetical protein
MTSTDMRTPYNSPVGYSPLAIYTQTPATKIMGRNIVATNQTILDLKASFHSLSTSPLGTSPEKKRISVHLDSIVEDNESVDADTSQASNEGGIWEMDGV